MKAPMSKKTVQAWNTGFLPRQSASIPPKKLPKDIDKNIQIVSVSN